MNSGRKLLGRFEGFLNQIPIFSARSCFGEVTRSLEEEPASLSLQQRTETQLVDVCMLESAVQVGASPSYTERSCFLILPAQLVSLCPLKACLWVPPDSECFPSPPVTGQLVSFEHLLLPQGDPVHSIHSEQSTTAVYIWFGKCNAIFISVALGVVVG